MKNKPYPLYSLPLISDLKDMVKQRVEEAPDAVAFSYMTSKEVMIQKTNKEFSDDIDAFGTYLYSKGLRNAHIAIIGRNSYEWIVAFLAIANGGNVAVPIDKNLSADKVEQLMKQSDCCAAVTSKKCSELIDGMENITRFYTKEMPDYIEEGKKLIDEGYTEFLDHSVAIDKMAAIFFTSGTTGDSKGVMLSHGNIASDVNAACKNFVLNGPTLAVLPFHHTFGLNTAVFKVFHYGFPVHINRCLKQLQSDLKLIKPQTILVVPLFLATFYKSVLTTAKKTGKDKTLRRASKVSDVFLNVGIDMRSKLFQSVRAAFGGNLEFVICGGAALDEKYIKAFRSWGITILNGYGITECSPVVSVNRNRYWRDGSVGQVLQGVEVKIAEDDEILVKGDNVMLGYYKDEAATEAVLNDGWYSTGDLGRIDEDGFLYITGRKKNLIILSNGENVSPEEIESQILSDDAVAEAVVFENKGMLAIEIFPSEEYLGNQEYFENMVKEFNKTQPQYKHLHKVRLRDEEFEKNSTKKILRFKVNEQNHA